MYSDELEKLQEELKTVRCRELELVRMIKAAKGWHSRHISINNVKCGVGRKKDGYSVRFGHNAYLSSHKTAATYETIGEVIKFLEEVDEDCRKLLDTLKED